MIIVWVIIAVVINYSAVQSEPYERDAAEVGATDPCNGLQSFLQMVGAISFVAINFKAFCFLGNQICSSS